MAQCVGTWCVVRGAWDGKRIIRKSLCVTELRGRLDQSGELMYYKTSYMMLILAESGRWQRVIL